ncbi:MAG: M48 family metalloprotease [Thermodesulfobacteriota bacterium]
MLRKILNWLAVAAMLPAMTGCAVNPVTGRSELAFYEMSEKEEIDIGKKAFPSAIQQMQGEVKDQTLQTYVGKVGLKLAAVSHRPQLPYRFVVVNDSTPNAFALPGGAIAITRGLLVGIENEAQLAAVLGHEIAHVTARHAAQGIQRGILLDLGVIILGEAAGSYSAVARQGGQLAATLIDNSYSREQESESDRLGIDYMVRVGYNPQGAVQLQEFFLKQSGEQDPAWIAGLFRTHPFSRERMVANQAYIRGRYPAALHDPAYTLAPEPFRAATAGLRKAARAYALYDEGRQEEQRKNLSRAVELYRQAVQAAPDQAMLQSVLGNALVRQGQVGAARPHLEKAVALDGGYYESRLGLGYVLGQEKEWAGAIRELTRSMELLPTLEGAYFLAEAHDKGGDRRQALTLYRQVAAADPNGRMGRAAALRARQLGGF